LTAAEVPRNKMFINHSCTPNVGIRGQIIFVALRDISAGEELTYDWAMEENRPDRTRCRCGTRRCRRVLTGQDWKIPGLQRRYRGYFSSYLAEKIRRGISRTRVTAGSSGQSPRRHRRRRRGGIRPRRASRA
jgi:hypothetical protein